MIGEIDLSGVFVSPLLVWAVVALAPWVLARWGLELAGAYRLVWHRALFDIALFVILWAAVAALSARLIHP